MGSDIRRPVRRWQWNNFIRTKRRGGVVKWEIGVWLVEVSRPTVRVSRRWPVFPLASGRYWGGSREGLYVGFSTLVARCWNACILAGQLAGLRPDTPPLILLDRLEEVNGQDGLHAFLSWAYKGMLEPGCDLSLPQPIPPFPSVEPTLLTHLNWF